MAHMSYVWKWPHMYYVYRVSTYRSALFTWEWGSESIMAMTMKAPINAVKAWLKAQPPKIKVFLALVVASFFIYLLHLLVEEQDNLFVAAEAVHAFGISVLVYKLTKGKSCAGTFTIVIYIVLRASSLYFLIIMRIPMILLFLLWILISIGGKIDFFLWIVSVMIEIPFLWFNIFLKYFFMRKK